MLGDGEGKIHFHPENRAQPVPTSAPLAWAQASSLCRGAQPPPNMAMLWSCFPGCWQGSHRVVGAGSLEGSGCRGHRLVQSSLQPGEGWRPRSAGVRAWLLPHHTRGSWPAQAAPAEAVKGAELPALHLGFLRATKGSGELEVPHCCWEKGEQPSASISPHGSPLLNVVRG